MVVPVHACLDRLTQFDQGVEVLKVAPVQITRQQLDALKVCVAASLAVTIKTLQAMQAVQARVYAMKPNA